MKLSDIRKLCEAALPGPWKWDYYQLVSTTVDPLGTTGDGVVMNMPGTNRPEPGDADFIAAARDLLPRLLAVAEAARSVNRQARACVPGGPSFVDLNEALAALESEP